MIKKIKIPTILGIFILIGGVFAGIFLLKNNQVFKIGASATITPKDVRISNVSDSSTTISWVTGEPTTGFVSYGTSENVGSIANESENNQKYYTHSITITGLSANSIYYFKIISNGTVIENNGVPWQFTTGKTLALNSTSIPVSGSVITASGQPSKRALIYITVGGYIVSSQTSDNGTFVLQLGSVRTPDLSSYAQIDSTETLLEISAITETGESATTKIFPQSANPIPALIVGQDQDFRNLQPVGDSRNPNADLSIPEKTIPQSKFDVSGNPITAIETVTLENLNEGEIVTSDRPQFFGDGPTGEEIIITVHSDTEIVGQATVSSNGSWKWSPPENLSEGAHAVTISWIDTLGITRTLTRNFIVQAGELPAFVASPSVRPSASPTPSIRPSNTPTPTIDPETLPETGTKTPSILFFLTGFAIIVFSFYVWRKSYS